ncbi:hypothetical protein V7S43_006828 [Phytophthora oleae]|uniref:E3 ubiquitin-protein ligase HERC2 n=1 Tax=Phytophthora oleae TaxID=2107226 RepID=A0ABD3FNR6_9STRA
MEALRLQDGEFIRDRYEELLDARRQWVQDGTADNSTTADSRSCELSGEERQGLEHRRIVKRVKALDAKGPTPLLSKKVLVLQDILEKLYAENEADPTTASPSNGALKRPDIDNANAPVPLKDLPTPTQVVLRMFFRTCQSLRNQSKLSANSRLSVQIASKLPSILMTMPSCVLSPGLTDEVSVQLEDGGNVSSVFYQLFQLLEELLGWKNNSSCLSTSDRTTVIVAYVALSLKWGRMGYVLKGVKLLLENANDLKEAQLEALVPFFQELAATTAERPQVAFGEEEQPCGYLMSFGKGDHGKLGHGQCVHVSCQEGNCTENKMVPTIIAATGDVLFRKIDSLSTHSIAITAKGEAMAWGNGDKYRLGHGSSTKEYTPRTIEFLSLKGRVRDLACGLGHTLALMESGEVFAWGNGSNGRLGLGDTNDRSSPTKVVIPTSSPVKEAEGGSDIHTTPVCFRHIFCGASHSLGISWDGRAYAWGKNNQGQCGHGHTNDQWTIQEIESFHDNKEGEEEECVTYAAGGWEHTLFCTASGRVYSCGCGYKDSRRAGIPPVLGHGDCDRRLKPSLVQAFDDAREEMTIVACGWDHSLAVSATGNVYTWGSGTNGKLGHGDEESFDIPTLVRGMEGKRVKDAKAGCEHTVFLTYDHELWTCGQGDSGRLGHGDSQTRKRPTKIDLFVESGLKPVALAVGDKYNLVLVRDSDTQFEQEGENELASTQKAPQRISNERVKHVTTGGHRGRHRIGQRKKSHDHEIKFGANWVLSIAVQADPTGATILDPDSASSAALFIAGHVDRLASDYISDESDVYTEKQQEAKSATTNSMAQQSILLPFAADTSYESLSALLQLLRWAASMETTEKTVKSENNGDFAGGSFLGGQERMALTLSCLRILQLNLKKSLNVSQSGNVNPSSVSVDLFKQIHELLDSLAGLKEGNSDTQSSGSYSLSAIESAISHEAACALKMGFGLFYPTGTSRCSLLWEVLGECKVHTPSMRTTFLSDQLCTDSIMTEIFRSLPSHGLLTVQNERIEDAHKERPTEKDIFDIQDLMIALLKRSSTEAIKLLDNEAFADLTQEPDCFLRLLHVLQMHYFSIAHRCAMRKTQENETGDSKDPTSQMMNSLLKYVDALMAESLIVLKKLHKGSRQHDEIITWRLNGSFFHTLLPSAIECLSILLQPAPIQSSVVPYATDNLLLVERILPNLHVMLKMLDEVSWKMHSAVDAGNQARDEAAPSYQLACTDQGRNWFIDLGNACAVLCGKLCCELLHPTRLEPGDVSQRGSFEAQVVSEGRILRENHISCVAKASSISRILEWERMGVFEVEDELVGCESDSSIGDSRLEKQRFLLQLCEDNLSKAVSFWTWIAGKLSPVAAFTDAEQRLMTMVVCVSSWHLDLSAELRSVYNIYDQNSTATDSIELLGGIWKVLSILIHEGTKISWACRSIDLEAMEKATKASQLLLSLEPNSALVPAILRRVQHKTPICESTGSSLSDMLVFLTKPVDMSSIQCSLDMKELNAALLRTGVCILHDLLRKLTTSSTKSCLLDEFVALTCAVNRANLTPVVSKQSFILRDTIDQHIDKAIENLFIRLARIVSSEDASFELKKKALITWVVPISATKRGVSSVVDLIAKSGIMGTLVELLLDEANMLDAHSDINATQPMTLDNQNETRKPTKVAPVKALLFDQTCVQVISVLAWEAFSAIVVQLSKSSHFVEHRSNILLRSAGPSCHEREPLTPRNASMSPRRRLTLPKKMVISSIDEIIEQMVDGLFLMLKGAKDRLNVLDISSREYEMLARSVEKSGRAESQVFLFGSPIQISHPSSHDIAIPKSNDIEGNASLTLMFWIFVEHTGAVVSKETPREIHSKDSSVRLVAFISHSSNSAEPGDTGRDASFTVFTRDVFPGHVSIGISMKFDGDTSESWRSILVDGQLPRGKWVQLVFGFHEEGPEHLQIFVGAKQSTINNVQQSGDLCKSFSLEFLRKATSWTRVTVGGNTDIDTFSTAPETSRLSVLPKKSPHVFGAVLDDVVITRGVITEEIIVRMQRNGPILFRLKQQHIAESHCANILRLLCQLVDSEDPSNEVSSVLLPSSDRWITLFTHILLTSCHDHGLAQVYLCYLLQNVLPRAVPPPGCDVNTLSQNLFGAHQIKTTSVEELLVELNGQSRLPSTSAIRRQNESLYRVMQQHGMLSGKYRGRILSDNGQSSEDALILKRTATLHYAAAIQLFQKLCNSPLWRSQMDQFIGSATTIFQSGEALKSAIQSEENNAFEFSDVAAVVSTLAGYSEEVVNGHRAFVQDAAMLPTPIQSCVSPFASVIHLDESSTDQVAAIRSLFTTMLKEETQYTLFLPARKEILERCHNDIAAVSTFDRRIGDVVQQRTRVLRVVMTSLLREKETAVTANTWHHLLLGDAAVCANLLRIASSNTKECILSLLGPDAKTAMKLRRLRFVVKELLGGSKHHHHALSPVSVAELETLQWRLWEETATGALSAARFSWWQQSSENKGKLALDVVGGDVELSDLKVKALEHFPTVRLAQANICANSGLWYFEVVVLTDGLMQIGYIEGDFIADPLQGQGVGDHANSWAFDGFRCKKWNVNSYDYGEQWKTGDVVGVLLDTERLDISYFLNGKCLGVAFSGISITATSRMCPAASLNVHQSAEFNFGTLPTTSSIEEASNVGGFKHLPVLDNEDQTRLRPVVMALHITSADGTANLHTAEKEKKNDASEGWDISSSDSDTDGEITLEGSDSLPGISRDGRETRTADPKYEESEQRRRDLVEGLTGLGFPLEWATQCATEARLPMDETGAVAWILEQMEKVGLDGKASRLPSSASGDDDGVECLSLHTALLRARMQLPNLVTSHSTDDVVGGLTTDTSIPVETLDIRDDELRDNVISNVSTLYQLSTSALDQHNAAAINAFIEADKDAQQSDDAADEAFQPGHFWRKQTSISSELYSLSDEVDDLPPLRIVVDTALFVAYSRQILTTLLLISSSEQEQGAAYEMIRLFLASEESSACLHQFIRIVIGLEVTDAAFCVHAKVDSGRSLELQKGVAALLRYEVRLESSSADEASPLLRFFFQEMMRQCERGVGFTHGKPGVKSASTLPQAAAAWFSWVSGVVIGFVEGQVSSSDGREETQLPDSVAAAFSSTEFLEKLVAIASTSSSAKAWQHVAFRLIARILCGLQAGRRSSAFYASAQLPHLTELLALRCRREMHNRVFFSDVTTTLFALLARSAASLSRDFDLDERRYSENQHANLRVSNYSSTHVTISWNQAPKADDLMDETIEATAVTDSGIVFLHVTRCGPHFPGSKDPVNTALKALPLKGTFTIRNLLPDTQYLIRVSPSQSADETSTSTTDTLNDADSVQGAQVLVQTPPDPVFELDKETIGKDLVVLKRNLTAKNTVNKKWHSVRASVAFEEGVHTWHVRLDTCVSKNIFIGVCTADASMENYIGSDAYGYGFLANKAVWHNKAKLHTYGEIFKQGDIIQVTLDCDAKTLAFSRNGEYLGIAASGMRAGTSRSTVSTANDGNCKWYPAFSMYNKDDKVTLIPPSATSTSAMKEGRPQNASTIEAIEAMQDVLAYQSHLAGESGHLELFEATFKEFDGWSRGQILFREISLGHVVGIDKSKSATGKYGLEYGDSVFTSKGQCNVLGEYRHELWYEVDEAGSPSLFGVPTSQLASWSLSTCRDMVGSPDEYPIHRYRKFKMEVENNTITEADSIGEQQNSPADTSDEVFSFDSFVNAQTQWSKNSISAAEADTKLIAQLDAIGMSQASSALSLSFADISTTLLLEEKYEVDENCVDNGSNQILARIGLLLYVNRRLYSVVRLAMPRYLFATSLEMSESLEPKKLYSSRWMNHSEYHQVSPVAALLNSPHWALDDPSAFSWMPSLAARLLFSSQKEKLIEEELRQTKTTSRTFDTLQEPSDADEVDTDLPVIKIGYPALRPVPFWECNSALLKNKKTYRLPLSTKSSVFVQLSKQLADQDGRQWRRESSQPFEAIPISHAFQVQIEKPLNEACGDVKEKNTQQADEDEEEDQELEQPSAKQTTQYLNIFENVVREIQSPVFPLFAPVQSPDGMAEGDDRRSLHLDVNLELFSPSALAYSHVQSSQLFLWYFCFGQVMGIAWRSKLLLPLQYISKHFWEELVSPASDNGCGSREAAIRAVRDGLFSIVPSRCVALLSGRNPSLRERLSDLDVSYVVRLKHHATYSDSRQRHHDLFWTVVNAFTAVERRMLEQFVNPERRDSTKQVEVIPDTATTSSFILEISDALADGRDHPDSCYPVVVPIGPYSSRLHLPAYSSAQTLRHKLLLAMTNIPFM